MKLFSCLLRDGCRSLRKAFASICRMRSRVTSKSWPTSSSVWSLFSPIPKRIRRTFSSRGVSVFRTLRVCSARFMFMTASAGDTTLLSSMKSPKCESSSSPIGVSRLMGSFDLEDLADLVERQLHLLRDFLRGRLAAVLLDEVAARSNELVDRLDHVDRDANRARLIRDGARDGLPDPPGGVRRELVAALVLELVDGFHQADVALLNEVEELQSAVRVFLRDAHDEAKVRLDELGLRLVSDALPFPDRVVRLPQLLDVELEFLLDLLQVLLRRRVRAEDVVGSQAVLALVLALRACIAARLARLFAELVDLDPGMLGEFEDAALGALDLLNQPAELRDDPIDRLLVEAHLLERLHHLLAVRVDFPLDALAARLCAVDERLLQVLRDLVEVLDLVDESQDSPIRLLFVELGAVVLCVADDVLDANLVLSQLVAEGTR